jgi:antimicrobial peptide system SdpB family protein
VIRLQVAVVYLHASVGKMKVEEWTNGTAVYYWFLHPVFGAADWLRPVLVPLLMSPVPVTVLTWGAVILELILFAGLFMERRHRRWLLWVGLAFHFGIVLVHGLVGFFFAMAGALILYLWPPDGKPQIRLPQRRAGPRATEEPVPPPRKLVTAG